MIHNNIVNITIKEQHGPYVVLHFVLQAEGGDKDESETGGSGSTSDQSCSITKGSPCGSSIAVVIGGWERKVTIRSTVHDSGMEGMEKRPPNPKRNPESLGQSA